VDELSPARSQAITEHADQARAAKQLATMRRDLELDLRPGRARALAARPVAAEGDVPALRVPQPPEPRRRARRGLPGRVRVGRRASRCRGARSELPRYRAGRSASPPTPTGSASRRRGGRRLAAPERLEGELVAHDAKAAARRGARRHDDPRLPDRAAAAEYALDDLRAEYGVELCPARGRGGDGRARAPRGARRCACATRCSSASASAGRAALPRDRAAADRGARGDGAAGVRIDTYRMGEITAPPRRPRRGARGEGVRARGRGVHARLDAAGRAVLFESWSSRRAARARPATRPTRASCARSAPSTRSSA
jgi:hypothetical protein